MSKMDLGGRQFGPNETIVLTWALCPACQGRSGPCARCGSKGILRQQQLMASVSFSLGDRVRYAGEDYIADDERFLATRLGQPDLTYDQVDLARVEKVASEDEDYGAPALHDDDLPPLWEDEKCSVCGHKRGTHMEDMGGICAACRCNGFGEPVKTSDRHFDCPWCGGSKVLSSGYACWKCGSKEKGAGDATNGAATSRPSPADGVLIMNKDDYETMQRAAADDTYNHDLSDVADIRAMWEHLKANPDDTEVRSKLKALMRQKSDRGWGVRTLMTHIISMNRTGAEQLYDWHCHSCDWQLQGNKEDLAHMTELHRHDCDGSPDPNIEVTPIQKAAALNTLPPRTGWGTQLPSDTLCIRCLGRGQDKTCLNPKDHAPTWLHDCADHGQSPDPFGRRSHSSRTAGNEFRDHILNEHRLTAVVADHPNALQWHQSVDHWHDPKDGMTLQSFNQPSGTYMKKPDIKREIGKHRRQFKSSRATFFRARVAQEEPGTGSPPPASDSPGSSTTPATSCNHCGATGRCLNQNCSLCGSDTQCQKCFGWAYVGGPWWPYRRKRKKKEPVSAAVDQNECRWCGKPGTSSDPLVDCKVAGGTMPTHAACRDEVQGFKFHAPKETVSA